MDIEPVAAAVGEREVIVIGGGLAGLAAAWTLREHRSVVVLEAADRFGGKAGSDLMGVDDVVSLDPLPDFSDTVRPFYSDHGYHLFPDFYENVRWLMRQVGINPSEVLVRGREFRDVVREIVAGSDGVAGAVGLLGAASKSRRAWQQTAMLLSAMVLVGTEDADLRDMDLSDILKELPRYIRIPAEEAHRGMILKALAGSAKESSALSIARMFRQWMRGPDWDPYGGSWSALNGPLQTVFIDPIIGALIEADVVLVSSVGVTGMSSAEGAITEITFRVGDDSRTIDVSQREIVLATPPDVSASLLNGVDYDGDIAAIANMMEPMTAVDLVIGLPGLVDIEPHFGFDKSMLELTAFNISFSHEDGWSDDDLPFDRDSRTVLQLIAARTGWLQDAVAARLPKSTAEERAEAAKETILDAIRGDIQRHLGDVSPSIEAAYVHLNFDAKLVLAAQGIHQFRPEYRPLGNLALAGDWMETTIDVPSMEAAVDSGRRAALAVLGKEIPQVPGPGRFHRLLRRAAYLFAWFPPVPGLIWGLLTRRLAED